MDGRTRLLTRGVDYDTKSDSFVRHARRTGRHHAPPLRVRTRVTDTTVKIRFVPWKSEEL